MGRERTPVRGWVPAVLVLLATSLCAVLPWRYLGIPSGHDFEFHVNSWIEVLNHWRQGVTYPHWAAWAHYGYGEARFIFYPPLSWMIGGALGAILPWHFVPAVYVCLALALAGLAMWALARSWLSPSSAVFAAVFYALNPYQLVIVYWRSAFAELLASALFPLLLLCVLRLRTERRMIVPLAVLLAAGWLTNIPSAVMLHYGLALIAVYLSVVVRDWRPVAHVALAVVCGATVAAVYLVPVLHQRTWVSLDQVLSSGLRPNENFLFAHTTDVDHDKFNHLISFIAACEFGLLAVMFLVWRMRRIAQLRWPLMLWSALCVALMLPFTAVFWLNLPELRYVQFPWRWLLPLNVAFVFVAASIPQRWLRAVVCLLALASVPLAARRILEPWWDTSADVREMVDNQEDRVGNEGVDEYAPVGVDPYDVDQNAPLAKYEGSGTAQVLIARWDAERRVITAQASAPGWLVLKLFNYPNWQLTVNDRSEHTGMTTQYEMTVPVRTGSNRVEVRFNEGWDRWAGGAISLCSLAALLVWYKRSGIRSAA